MVAIAATEAIVFPAHISGLQLVNRFPSPTPKLTIIQLTSCGWPKAEVRGIIRVDNDGGINNYSRHGL